MNTNPLSDWSRSIRALSESIALDALPRSESQIATFRDEYGHRRAVDEPLLRLMSGMPTEPPELVRASPDVALWWATLDDGIDVWPWIESDGSALTHRTGNDQIEIWTETELGALHAAWTVSEIRSDTRLVDRCLAAAEWHVAELQPDNATNHPWAVQVFLELWDRTGRAEARMHAETLVHNCTVHRGHPDDFSAILLLHAARSLDARCSG